MKRILISYVLLILTFSMLFIGGCAKNQENDHSTYIGIISAMDNEIEVLLSEAKIERTDSIGGVKYHVGTLRGKSVVISRAGIGKIRSASGVTTMLDKYDISKVIFTGIAGGVADETDVLDEVIATSLIEHDYGKLTNEGFEWLSGDPGFSDKPGEYYVCDPDLVDLAYESAVKVLGENFVHKGVIATGDQFIASEDYVNMLKNDYNAYACEMEGAAIAVVCQKYNKPFVVIRALSDKADGKANEYYENFGDIASDNSSHIVLKMLETMQ